MSEKNFSVEDILNEYPADRSRVKYGKARIPDAPKGRLETEALLEKVEKDSDKEKNDAKISSEIIDAAIKSENQQYVPPNPDDILNKIKENQQKQAIEQKASQPSSHVHPDSFLRSRISFVNALGDNDIKKEDEISEGYESAVVVNKVDEHAQPKIRRMNDSSRAKEIQKKKKHKRIKKDSGNYGYEKESPDGSYVTEDFRPKKAVKKKNKKNNSFGKNIPFHSKNDVVEGPGAYKHHENDDSRFDVRAFSHDAKDGDILDIPIEKKKNKKDKSYTKQKKDLRSRSEIIKEIHTLRTAVVTRIMILFLLAALSLALSAAKHYNLSIYQSLLNIIHPTGIYIFHAIIGILACIAAYPTVKYGLRRLFTFHSDCDTMPALALVACVASSIASAIVPSSNGAGINHIFVPVAIVAMICNTFGKLYILNRAERNIRFITEGYDWYAAKIVSNEDNAFTLTHGLLNRYPVLMSLKKTSGVADFLKYTYSSDAADKYCRISSPIYVILSLIATALITYFRHGNFSVPLAICYAISVFTAFILLTCCMGINLVVNIPLMKATKKFSGRDGAIFGYQGVEDFYDTNSVMLDAKRLFPSSSVQLTAAKVLFGVHIKENLFLGASLVNSSKSVLKDAFVNEFSQANTSFYDISNFKYEDGCGIYGWADNKRIILGSRQMMINHKIDGLPPEEKEASLIQSRNTFIFYLAVSGTAVAIFAVEFSRNKKVDEYLNSLARNNIRIVLKSCDFMIDEKLIRSLYGIKDEVKIIPAKDVDIFDAECREESQMSASVICSGRLSSTARILAGIKNIRMSARIGLSIQLMSAILGFILGGIYVFTGAFNYLSAYLILIFQLIFLIITIIALNIKKI